jgi:mono/diheme cytochrome c family protein
MSSHIPNKTREFSHPALWTVGLVAAAGAMGWAFFSWLEVGMQHGRDAGPVNFAHAEVAKPVDHPALIADRSQAVLDRGQQLYSKNCASCHGPNGDQNMTGTSPAPRNFRTEVCKADWGGGPYGFFLTLTKGYGQGMPAFSTLEAADRYAIAHFVRESWQKDKPFYAADDKPEIAAQIPKPGTEAESGPRTPPHLVEQNPSLHPLMAYAAQQGATRCQEAQAWISTAIPSAEPGERDLLRRVQAAGLKRGGWLLDLQEAARSGDKTRVAALIIAADSGDPSLALAPAASVDAAAAVLMAAAVQKA